MGQEWVLAPVVLVGLDIQAVREVQGVVRAAAVPEVQEAVIQVEADLLAARVVVTVVGRAAVGRAAAVAGIAKADKLLRKASEEALGFGQTRSSDRGVWKIMVLVLNGPQDSPTVRTGEAAPKRRTQVKRDN